MFRGREVTHPERGTAILDRLAEELSELGVVEQRPMQEGRNMTMMMAPSKAVLAGQAETRTRAPARGGGAWRSRRRARPLRLSRQATAPVERGRCAGRGGRCACRGRRRRGPVRRRPARDAGRRAAERRGRLGRLSAISRAALRRAPSPADPGRPRPCHNHRSDAQDEDTLRRQEALQGHRHRQGARAPPLHEPHPREEVAQAQAHPGPRRRSSQTTTRRASSGCWGSANDTGQALGRRAQEAPRDARADQGLPRRGALQLQARQGGPAQGRRLRLPRPPQPQARLPPAVDHPHQRRRAAATG